MTIDPLTIPCAYCGGSGEITAPERMSMEKRISCKRCRIVLEPPVWIAGGINALVGKLVRKGVMVWQSPEGWTWDSEDEEGKAWQTFEYCVLDAWEKSKMGEEEG